MTSKERDQKMLIEMKYEQTIEIQLGKKHGINTDIYDDRKKFMPDQMKEIRLGLEKGIHILDFIESWRCARAMREIRLGLESGIDVSIYNKSEYYSDFMREIRLGLESGVFNDKYLAIVGDNHFQMLSEIHTALLLDIDIDVEQYKKNDTRKEINNYREEIRNKINNKISYTHKEEI